MWGYQTVVKHETEHLVGCHATVIIGSMDLSAFLMDSNNWRKCKKAGISSTQEPCSSIYRVRTSSWRNHCESKSYKSFWIVLEVLGRGRSRAWKQDTQSNLKQSFKTMAGFSLRASATGEGGFVSRLMKRGLLLHAAHVASHLLKASKSFNK